MRPILAGISAALVTTLANHFVEGVFKELVFAIPIGALAGILVMFLMRPRTPEKE